MAQLGIPDMKAAIAYALSYPERLALKQPSPDFKQIGIFTFIQPDLEKFPCLALAFDACKKGGTFPAVLNAANEVAVDAFLNYGLPFVKIPSIIRNTMDKHAVVMNPALNDILEADDWARARADDEIRRLKPA
jgi:1-deoxy-D-xylulose-5-phosphate reductoisomerase